MVTLKEGEAMKVLLIMGRDSAAQLEALLQPNGPGLVQDLVSKVKRSLDEMFSFVNAIPFCPTDSGEVSQNPATTLGSPSGGDRSCVDSGESGKRPATKDRKGGSRKRRTSEFQVQVSTTTEDGFAWRKYGQKAILNAKYPRCYYRCTHKFDQGCLANKHVQIIGEGQQKFQSTYFGRHTCTNVTNPPSAITVDSIHEDPCLISFESKSSSSLTEQNYDSTSIEKLTPTNKEDIKKETPSDPTVDMRLMFWPDVLIAHNEDMLPEFWSSRDSTNSYGELGKEFFMESFDFDKVFSS